MPHSILSPDEDNIVPPDYSEKENKVRGELIQRLTQWRDNRDKSHPELDNMTYLKYYDENRKKDLSYIPPKQNKNDVRIVTGTTREKDTTVLSLMQEMNLEPDITAFDTDNLPVMELGDNMSDMVKKSRQIENWQKKRPMIYREMISQGDVFVEEVYTEDFRHMPVDRLDWDPRKDGISKFSFKERLKNVFSGCEARMLDGRKVYMASLREEYIEDQPGVAILNIYDSRAQAEAVYGEWERWENVPKLIDTLNAMNEGESPTYNRWNLVDLDHRDQVAEIKVFLPYENRFQIFLNGVMMLPVDYPMTAIAPSGVVPIAQGKFEPISNFCYSKSQPAKTKVDQEVLDEMTKLMVEKTRQSFKPPMGNKSGKVFSQKIFDPGRVTNDVTPNTLFPLLQQVGVNNSEFSFYNLIAESINNKSANDIVAGQAPEGEITATEAVQRKEQQMKKLGHALDGAVNLERQMTWNRIYNILQNWTKPVDKEIDQTRRNYKNIFSEFSVDTTLENGQQGEKIFRMTDEAFPDGRELEQEEVDMSKERNREVRIVYLDPNELQKMKHKWFVYITPTPESNDQLSQLMFMQNITQGLQIFGPEAFNMEYVKQRWASTINEDYNKIFRDTGIQQLLQSMSGAGGQGSDPAAAAQPQQGGGQQQPTFSQAANAGQNQPAGSASQ